MKRLLLSVLPVVCLSVCPFVRLSICPFVRLSVCPFVCLNVRLPKNTDFTQAFVCQKMGSGEAVRLPVCLRVRLPVRLPKTSDFMEPFVCPFVYQKTTFRGTVRQSTFLLQNGPYFEGFFLNSSVSTSY